MKFEIIKDGPSFSFDTEDRDYGYARVEEYLKKNFSGKATYSQTYRYIGHEFGADHMPVFRRDGEQVGRLVIRYDWRAKKRPQNFKFEVVHDGPRYEFETEDRDEGYEKAKEYIREKFRGGGWFSDRNAYVAYQHGVIHFPVFRPDGPQVGRLVVRSGQKGENP